MRLELQTLIWEEDKDMGLSVTWGVYKEGNTGKNQKRVCCHRSKERTAILGMHPWALVSQGQPGAQFQGPRAHSTLRVKRRPQEPGSASPAPPGAECESTGDKNCICHLSTPECKTFYETPTFKDWRKRGVTVMMEHCQGYQEIRLICKSAHTIQIPLPSKHLSFKFLPQERFNKLPSYSASIST